MIGYKVGRWTVIKPAGTSPQQSKLWLCECDCGTKKVFRTSYIRAGKSQSCGCLRKQLRSLAPGEAAFNHLLAQFKRDAKNHGRQWLLTDDQVRELTKAPCFYCGEPPSNECNPGNRFNGAYVYTGIDRLDSNGHYEYDNCLPACADCNYMKRTLHVDAWLYKVNEIALRHQRIPYPE